MAEPGRWGYRADVVCVGSGAAALSAAIAATDAGASVLIVEKMAAPGGTTARSRGIAWIPNNHVMRAEGIIDDRADCLRYLARYGFPASYDATSATLGLSPRQYRLLEAFYDNGSAAIELLVATGAVDFRPLILRSGELAIDYGAHLPENRAPCGRPLEPIDWLGDPGQNRGRIVELMLDWLRARHVPILTGVRVTAILFEDGRAIGVAAATEGRTINIRADRGVIFGSGGYAHNPELIRQHQTILAGSCAAPCATGDLIGIAAKAGAKMGSLGTAWYAQVVMEEVLENRCVDRSADVLPGDSMILVNRLGQRVVNEKRDYCDRTRVHFAFDATRAEYVNQLLFMVFDARSLDAFGGNYPLPPAGETSPFVIRGASWDDLATNITARLPALHALSGNAQLAPDFAETLSGTVERFNGHARAGNDPEFGRGSHDYDRVWHGHFSARRAETAQPLNAYPNVTMHPFSATGPYYAMILGAGALDTSGGPAIDEHARLTTADDEPIEGLYGAGNCVASPSNTAYYGGGGTIGLAITFGYIAGRHATSRHEASVMSPAQS